MRTKTPIEWARPLVFAWPSGQPFYFILPAMIFLAAMLHLVALGAVRLVYPEPRESRLAPAQLVVLPADDGFWQSQFTWIAAADPSLFSPARVEFFPETLDAPSLFQPSFLAGRLRWLAPAEEQQDLAPTFLVSRPVSVRPLRPAEPMAGPRPSPPEGSLRLIGENQEEWPLPEDLRGMPLPALPTVFLVEVAPDGLPNYIFLETSSGSPEWDAAAERALRTHSLPVYAESTWRRLAVGPGARGRASFSDEPSLSIP